MQYVTAILQTRPLTIHFSLYHPADSDEPAYVPRLLEPLGAFVGIEVLGAGDRVVYESPSVKLRLKLDPSNAESYWLLEPGYTYGAVLTVDSDELQLSRGEYELELRYSNLEYVGFDDHRLGKMTHETTLGFSVG